jgi:hypothetical protein
MQAGIEDSGRLTRMDWAGRRWYERERLAEGKMLQEMHAALAVSRRGVRRKCQAPTAER